MKRFQSHVLAVAALSLGLLVAAPARAASLTMVNRTTWGATGVPSYVQMYIYVPDKLAAKPPILAAHHSCGTTDAMYYFGNLPKIKAAADKNGFIIIVPLATTRNCWDVGTTASLKHDGGGDTQAIAQMVKYALTKYNGDPSRVYAMGGSSGAMMTQALLAVYPDLFRAGSARAGVPAGCWADGYDATMQWSNNCANGNTKKTPQQWGDGVRAMYPSYTGHRPRLQIFHGTADATINYANFAEAIDEWTNVLGLNMTATSTDTLKGSAATWNRQLWKNACGFTVFEASSASGAGHSMTYEEDAIIAFLGLDKTDGDPETDCSGGSDGGAPDASGAGGTSGNGGRGGAGGGGVAGSAGGSPGTAGAGGAIATGGSTGAAGVIGAGGSAGSAGGTTGGSAGAVATGGSVGVAGSSAKGGSGPAGAPGAAGSVAAGGSPGAGGSTSGGDEGSTGLCSYGGNGAGMRLTPLLLVGLTLVLRRRRRTRH